MLILIVRVPLAVIDPLFGYNRLDGNAFTFIDRVSGIDVAVIFKGAATIFAVIVVAERCG